MTIGFSAMGQTEKARKVHFNLDKNGVALSGYDAVAYVAQQKAVEGDPKYTFAYKGVTYWFASSADLNLFKLNPEKYEPAYGGWCAYAMGATGEKVEVDPKTFKIINSKLYLFYHSLFNNTLNTWNKEENTLKPKADKNWTGIIAK